MASHASAANDSVRRVFAEYREMPGLILSERQASRLFGLPPAQCRAVLALLVERGVLAQRDDGAYVYCQPIESAAYP